MVEGEKLEREMSYCSSPLFFCFSVLSFYSLISSSLPFSVRLPFSLSSKFCPPLFVPLFLKKIIPLSVFYSLPCIYRQPGERYTIPYPSAGHGGVGVAGYGCVGMGMGHAGFLGKWGGEREGKNSGKIFQKSPSPLSAFAGEKKLHRAVQNGTVHFFFKEN
jgi:hypothetical protein